MHWTNTLFITVVCAVPTGATCVAYFLLGPAMLTYTQYGLITGCTYLIYILTTFVAQFAIRPHRIAVPVAMGMVFVQWFLLLCIGRFHRQLGISDFIVCLGIFSLDAVFRGCLNATYVTSMTESTRMGREARDYAWRSTTPQVGKFVNLAADFSLTVYYGVDHDNFAHLGSLLATTTLLALIAVWTGTLLTPERS